MFTNHRHGHLVQIKAVILVYLKSRPNNISMNKKNIILLILLTTLSCQQMRQNDNPLLQTFNTPYGVPDFGLIKPAHFRPAFNVAIAQMELEISEIAKNEAAATFVNTIESLEYAGETLRQVESIYDNLKSSHTNNTLLALAQEINPRLEALADAIYLNKALFERVKSVYNMRNTLDLAPEQQQLLQKKYEAFVRRGALLSDTDKQRLMQINQRQAVLSETFTANILKETNAYRLVITNTADLAGLPAAVITAAREKANELNIKNAWVFTLQKPSFIPFLQYAENRGLRKQIFKAYINRCNNNNQYDNKAIVKEFVNLRIERASLLGYNSHAHYILDKNIAKTPEQVYAFLEQVMKPAVKVSEQEAQRLQAYIRENGEDIKLEPWDWWFYSEKIRKRDYSIDENELRQYFKLGNVRDGMFTVAEKLWGLQFKQRTDIPVYQADVLAYEVCDSNSKHIGIMYMDFFPRENKKSGAWMNSYRKQSINKGQFISPVVTTNFNFTEASANTPALLTIEEVETMYHEFGHALHGLLSECTYHSLSGTSVPRDFVELPSQIMENWATEPQVLKMYARHYKTGEIIPQELIDKLNKARLFNQGFETTEYMSACYLDMDLHTMQKPFIGDILDFEQQSVSASGLIPEIVVRYRIPYFAHIFSYAYSAGYYSYIWADIMVADAYTTFQEKGIFNQEAASSFRKNILSKGGTADAIELYIKFKGQPPSVTPLLKRKGLI